MNENSQPEWMKNFKPVPHNGNPHSSWNKGMPSPNPKGRPKGIVDKRSKVTQVLLGDAPAIARVVIDAALAGDTQAAALVLSRVAPALKAQSECVMFDFDAKAPLAEQVESILQAIANGQLSPDIGKQIIETISALGAIRQLDQLEQRLSALEGRR